MESSPISRHLMLVAGEISGDNHAASLVSALKTLDPSLTFSGLGGPKMQETGVALDEDLTRFAVVGFWEVLKHWGDFARCFDTFLKNVAARKPAAVILVDYPGFNLRLAGRLKKMGVPVIYYISPQVWAWKENRVRFIKNNVDLMLVIFEFEKKFYADRGVEAVFVGHPLADEVKPALGRTEILSQTGLSPDKITVGILPGSRRKEIETLLPPMVDAAGILARGDPRLQFLVLKAPHLPPELYENFLTKKPLPIKILSGKFYDGLNVCKACIVASGTATLETALMLKPMAVVYKTSFLTFLLAKALIRIPYIALVNVVAGKLIVPECLQNQATGEKIAREIKKFISDQGVYDSVVGELAKVKASLGLSEKNGKAARKILCFLKNS